MIRRALFALALPVALGACSRPPPEPTPAASMPAALGATPAPPAAAPNASLLAIAPASPAAPPTGCPADPDSAPPLPTAPVVFDSGPRVTAELAVTPRETERGLMYRTAMPEEHGMLFRLGAREDHAFWMHNTCIPLDMLFLDQDGTIVGILDDVPILNDEPRGVGKPSTHVLEVNAGWCKRHGVRAGQKLLLPASAK